MAKPISSFRFVTEEVSNGVSLFIDFQSFAEQSCSLQSAPYISVNIYTVLRNYRNPRAEVLRFFGGNIWDMGAEYFAL
jgi:hypothetical protein